MMTEENEEGSVEPAETTSTPDVTEGSESSAESVEQSIAEQAVEKFLREEGDGDPVPKEEPEEEPEESDEPEEPEAEAEVAEETTEQVEDPEERIPDEDFKKLPDSVRSRIGYLSSQVKDAKAELAKVSEKAEGDARAIDALNTFTRDNNLTSQDVDKGLHIMAMLQNGDMKGFHEAITPFYQMAEQAIGKAVTPEVQELIDNGDITPEAGARMTQAEKARELAEAQAQRLEAARQQQAQQQAQVAHVESLKQAVANTEAALKTADPDFALKADTLKATLAASIRNGLPKDATAMAQLVKDIHGSIKVPRATPKPTAARPSATSGTPRATEPKNVLEAVEMAAESFGQR